MTFRRTSRVALGAAVTALLVALAGPVDAGAPLVLSVDPASGLPGTEVSVSGFPDNSCVVTEPSAPLPRILGVVVTFTPDVGPTVDLGEPRPKDLAGGAIPVDASPGPATLTVYCLEQEVDSSVRRDYLDEIDFTVRPGAPPTPPTSDTTSTTTPAPEAPSAQPRFTG